MSSGANKEEKNREEKGLKIENRIGNRIETEIEIEDEIKKEGKKEIETEMKDEKDRNNEIEEDRAKKIYELEKILGRHDQKKKMSQKRDQKLIKYFLVATNMIYILVGPVVLMLGFYLLLEKFLFKKEQPIILIIFLFLGAISGYWTLIKQVTNIK